MLDVPSAPLPAPPQQRELEEALHNDVARVQSATDESRMTVTVSSDAGDRDVSVRPEDDVHEALCEAYGIAKGRLGEVSFGGNEVMAGECFGDHGMEATRSLPCPSLLLRAPVVTLMPGRTARG